MTKKLRKKMIKAGIIPHLILWMYIKIHSIFIRVGIALHNTEADILSANPDDFSEAKKSKIKYIRNPLFQKFEAGQRDEKYVKDYYELLKKADKFIRKATPREMAVAADKYGTSYGMKDQYGRRYEHYGFFDEKHKHKGKTIGEVIALEFEERRTKDDDYELLHIFNNKPIEVGLANIMDVLEKSDDENADFEYKVVDVFKKSKQFQFPIKINREIDVVNKIEQLSEFLHVKKIGFDYRQLEFFIPLKFKTVDVENNSEVFKELVNIDTLYIKDEYGELLGFAINKFTKRIVYNNTHEVWKFEGIEMQNIKL
jgi:hypothetical protein